MCKLLGTYHSTTADHAHPYQWQWHYLMAVTPPASGGILQCLAPQNTPSGPVGCEVLPQWARLVNPDQVDNLSPHISWAIPEQLWQSVRAHCPAPTAVQVHVRGVYVSSICVWAGDACHPAST